MKSKKSILTNILIVALLLTLVVFPTGAASINNWQIINYMDKVDIYMPLLSISNLKIDSSNVSGTVLFDNKKNQMNASFKYLNGNVSISLQETLSLKTLYILKIFMEDGRRIQIKFTTYEYPPISSNGERQIILMPAMPEKGFYWPYYLAIPSNRYKETNKGSKRYLMVESNNTGPSNDFDECLKKTKNQISNLEPYSFEIAEKLWTPALMPVFPRPNIDYTYNNEFNMFYTHAFDRDIATLHLKMKITGLSGILTDTFKNAGYDVNKLYRLDVQLEAMIDNAIEYLNKNSQGIEKKKVFVSGYSASGTFVDRFAFLHPDRVKAYAAGAATDDMVLPLSEYKGEKLIFPLGTSDFKDITGKIFDLSAHNKVPRLIYMGEDDDNNVVKFSDCYGDNERNIITKLWGMDLLPRAKQLTELYGKSGGKGMFILDKGVKHSFSTEMRDYIYQFFRENRQSDIPAYPLPQKPDQLKYTLFK